MASPFPYSLDLMVPAIGSVRTSRERAVEELHEVGFHQTRQSSAPGYPVVPWRMGRAVGSSPRLVDVFKLVERVSDTDCTVLITGESGTGKELVARAVHQASPRADAPFVRVDCGAIPEALLDSELFGHASGTFGGAHAATPGRIAQAERGTLFLDDIGLLPLELQFDLLHVLEAKEYSPIGDTLVLKANVRVVAATSINLEEAVRDRIFREDLYYRLNVVHVSVPPLRARRPDIPLLARHFLTRECERMGRQVVSFSPAALDALLEYDWPGNVRELKDTVEHAVLLCHGPAIQPTDLFGNMAEYPSEKRSERSLPVSGLDLRAAVESYENDLIRQALERTKWNKNQAAKLLGLNRTTLVEMLKRKRMIRAA